MVNPYEPPQLHELDFNLESLAFDGIIEKADYQRMLPRGDREWWLCLILAILLGCILLVSGPLSVLMFLSKRDLPSGVSLIGFWTLMPAGLWFLKGRISSADRASRMLRKYPDLLGIAQGEFTREGLTFHDGIRTFWFGPQQLLQTDIRFDGIRVPVGGGEPGYRFLALSARLFDGYDVNAARGLKQQWEQHAGKNRPAENSADQIAWNRIGKPPEGAISYQGWVTSETPAGTKALRNELILEGFAIVSLASLIFFVTEWEAAWMFWAVTSFLCYTILAALINLWSYFKGKTQQTWYQSGWISPLEMTIYYNGVGILIPLNQVQQKLAYPSQILLVMKSGQSIIVLRDMVENDEQWQKLCDMQIHESNSITDEFCEEK